MSEKVTLVTATPAATPATPSTAHVATVSDAGSRTALATEAFRAAVMNVFLNDNTLGVGDVDYPDPSSFEDLDSWIDEWAVVEIQRGPRHGMQPENRFGLRWVAWLGLVPYGVWSETVARASMDEFRLGTEHHATQVLAPALSHFGLLVAEPVTIDDLSVAVSSAIEGCWLNSALTADDPLNRPTPISTTLATTLRLLIRGATVRAGSRRRRSH